MQMLLVRNCYIWLNNSNRWYSTAHTCYFNTKIELTTQKNIKRQEKANKTDGTLYTEQTLSCCLPNIYNPYIFKEIFFRLCNL